MRNNANRDWSQLAGVVGGLSAVVAALAVVVIIERHSVSAGLVLGLLLVMAALLLTMGVFIGFHRRSMTKQ